MRKLLFVFGVIFMLGCQCPTGSDTGPGGGTGPVYSPAYYGTYLWDEVSPMNVSPVLTDSDIAGGTGITGSKRTLDLQFRGVGWLWFASRWGNLSNIYLSFAGSWVVMNPAAYSSYTVLVDGVVYTVYVIDGVQDIGSVLPLRFEF